MAIQTLNQKSASKTASKSGECCGIKQVGGSIEICENFPHAHTVLIAGDFNNWKPEKTPMKKSAKNGNWTVKLSLKPGTYHYRLVVDGKWQQDPNNCDADPNPYGEYDSRLQVR